VLVCGAAITLLEFTAVRLLAPFFGQSPIVWTNVIAVVLLALALGAWLGGRWSNRPNFRRALIWLPLPAAAWIAGAARFGPRFAQILLPDGFRDGPDPTLALLGSLEAALVLFAPPLMLLGAITPLVLAHLAPTHAVGASGGVVLALSTVGSVLGAYLANLVLIPWLGTQRTLLTCAALLCAASLWVRALAHRPPPPRAIALALLCAFACASFDAGPLKGPGIAGDRVLFERDSVVQTVRVLERDIGDRTTGTMVTTRILALDEGDAEFHSARIEGRIDSGGRYFDTLALLPLLQEPPADGTYDVLVIGFAAGTLFTELDALLGPTLRLTGVEIDPLVLDVAASHFDLDRADPRLTLIVDDGRTVVNTLMRDQRFDLVVVDAYAHQTYIPFQVATRECFARIREHLEPTGLLALNVDCRRPAARLPRALAATLHAAELGPVWLTPVRDFPSAILFCGARDETPTRLLREPPPFLTAAATAFRSLLLRPTLAASEQVFVDDHAPVERVMQEQLERGTVDDTRSTYEAAFDSMASSHDAPSATAWREAQRLRFEGEPHRALAGLLAHRDSLPQGGATWATTLAAEIEAYDLASPSAALARTTSAAVELENAALADDALRPAAERARHTADWYVEHAAERDRAHASRRALTTSLAGTLVGAIALCAWLTRWTARNDDRGSPRRSIR
ncbi:MAG: fused MFS/spermidine synthase, partial [Planctomycetes bacterium]|nr:fused MFS/spermidine synthase [Planctomycetota bacterium]